MSAAAKTPPRRDSLDRSLVRAVARTVVLTSPAGNSKIGPLSSASIEPTFDTDSARSARPALVSVTVRLSTRSQLPVTDQRQLGRMSPLNEKPPCSVPVVALRASGVVPPAIGSPSSESLQFCSKRRLAVAAVRPILRLTTPLKVSDWVSGVSVRNAESVLVVMMLRSLSSRRESRSYSTSRLIRPSPLRRSMLSSTSWPLRPPSVARVPSTSAVIDRNWRRSTMFTTR